MFLDVSPGQRAVIDVSPGQSAVIDVSRCFSWSER